jgi:tetratricopeptide (TPR) repeat protein
MWSDTYDARLDDIFYIQENIARSVAGALSIALEVAGRNHLPGTGTDNIEAYDVFLEGRAAQRGRGGDDLAAALYQRAIDLDPEYAEAWAGLGATFGVRSFRLSSEEARASQEHGRELVVRATKLDPNLALAYGMLSGFQWARGDWVGATELHQKYTALAPADVAASLGPPNVMGKTGRLRDSTRIREIRYRNDPLNLFGYLIIGELYIQTGRYDDALTALANLDRLSPPPNQGTALRRMFLAITLGEAEEIREALGSYAIADPRVATVVKAILDEFDSAPTVVLGVMRRIYEDDAELTGEGRMVIASMAAHYGDADFALEIMTEEFSVNMLRTNRLWYPFFSDMRSLPGFKTLAEDIGFVEYWRKYGWADTCRPIGAEDFECN